MKKAIHILFVEGVPADVVIMKRELRTAGLALWGRRLKVDGCTLSLRGGPSNSGSNLQPATCNLQPLTEP